MKRLVIYVHGKGGSAGEADHYRPLFPDCEVVGFDYRAQTPWEAREEFPRFFGPLRAEHDSPVLIANSLGAFLSMTALSPALVDRALFISPVVDMEGLIAGMMAHANVTEDELRDRGVIPLDSGETLSWDWLDDVRSHPILWTVPTRILYGERDFLTPFGLCVEKLESEFFRLSGMSRGWVLPASNLLILTGMYDAGKVAEAKMIARRYCDACAKWGISMLLDPIRGTPNGFACSWSANTFLVLADLACNQ